jgi:putative SOS response-associated peptidase YedK
VDLPAWSDRHAIAPTADDVFIRERPDGTREAVPSRWGLIPRWAKSRDQFNPS